MQIEYADNQTFVIKLTHQEHMMFMVACEREGCSCNTYFKPIFKTAIIAAFSEAFSAHLTQIGEPNQLNPYE